MRKKTLIKANTHLTEALSMQCIMTLFCTSYIEKSMATPASGADKAILRLVLVITLINLLYIIADRIITIIQRGKDLKGKNKEDTEELSTEEKEPLDEATDQMTSDEYVTSEEVFPDESDNKSISEDH